MSLLYIHTKYGLPPVCKYLQIHTIYSRVSERPERYERLGLTKVLYINYTYEV